MEKCTNYDDGYNLHSMDIKYEYTIDDISNSGYTVMQGVVDANENAVDMDVAWEALRVAAQATNPYDITSNTQWSIIFNNTDATAQIALRRNWEDKYDFAFELLF